MHYRMYQSYASSLSMRTARKSMCVTCCDDECEWTPTTEMKSARNGYTNTPTTIGSGIAHSIVGPIPTTHKHSHARTIASSSTSLIYVVYVPECFFSAMCFLMRAVGMQCAIHYHCNTAIAAIYTAHNVFAFRWNGTRWGVFLCGVQKWPEPAYRSPLHTCSQASVAGSQYMNVRCVCAHSKYAALAAFGHSTRSPQHPPDSPLLAHILCALDVCLTTPRPAIGI